MIEITPKYTLTEEFDNTTKTVQFETTGLTELFSQTMDFLKYCGISKDSLLEMFNEYKEGCI